MFDRNPAFRPVPMRILCALLAVALLATATPAVAQDLLAQDALVSPMVFEPEARSFEVTDAAGVSTASRWNVFEKTGNCCENHIVTDAAGRLYDFGGTYINFSPDRGKNWWRVRPNTPLYAAEGTLVAAPGGDMLGVVWDLYGDYMLAFKFEAATAKWRYTVAPVHTPYYDREWIGVVPGPIDIDGQTAPWVSFVKGGVTKEEWLYSTDGLTYAGMSNKPIGAVANGTVRAPLPITPSPDLDVVNAPTGMGLTPLGGGRALADPDFLYLFSNDQSSGYALLDSQPLHWSDYRLPAETPNGQFRVDSRGWVHNVVIDDEAERRAFEYRVSDDGGQTFRSARVALPEGMRMVSDWDVDVRVNGELGLAAVAVHGDTGGNNADGDLLYKLDVRGPQPALLRTYRMGKGDSPTNSIAEGSPRFDFASMSMFPDGRVAMSFLDTETLPGPALAVEVGEPVPEGFWGSEPPAPGPVSPGPAAPAHEAPKPVDAVGPSGMPHHVRFEARRSSASSTTRLCTQPRESTRNWPAGAPSGRR